MQRTTRNRVHAPRHHAALHHFEEDVALGCAAVPLARLVVVVSGDSLEAPRRILKPAHAADVRIEPRVSVSDDVEAGALLILEVGADGVGVLLAESCVSERIAK